MYTISVSRLEARVGVGTKSDEKILVKGSRNLAFLFSPFPPTLKLT